MFSRFLDDLLTKKYKTILVSSTSKNSSNFLRLPDRIINGELTINILVADIKIAKQTFQYIDGKVPNVFVDIEQKQPVNLFEIARSSLKYSRVIPYKPNDITLEAADQLINNYFNQDLLGKSILIYGTGNISTKLAVRLAERQANIYMAARNKGKLIQILKALNLILPTYTERPIRPFYKNKTYDALVSFVSAEKVVNEEVVDLLKDYGIAIDGGIGNFSEKFIAESISRNIRVLRLDVRIGLPFLEASILANSQSFFEEVMGEYHFNDINIVAGGIIGSEGSVIVDKIKRPSQIIGIANGIGGVKDGATLTDNEKRNIETVRKHFLQDRKTDF